MDRPRIKCFQCQKNRDISDSFFVGRETDPTGQFENNLLCGACAYKHHKDHDATELERASMEEKESLLQDLRNKRSEASHNLNVIHVLRERIGRKLQHIQRRIHETMESIKCELQNVHFETYLFPL
uniref:Uncharacterized protein n=1 Tax=Steinernema glaseri TaxID=37863 RepID=A0A1I7ZA76_9BILA